MKHFGIETPDLKKPEGLKPKKPPLKDAPEGPPGESKKHGVEKTKQEGDEKKERSELWA